MGLAAATVTTSFAQGENVTSKLRNVDMAQGVAGWMIEGDQGTFYTQNKPQLNYSGYHGINNQVLENWVGAPAALPDCSLYQRVQNLTPGTYVFGAYVAASLQGTEESNREEVVGVSVFANEDAVPAATENPERTNFKWAHSSKFNVATKVTEGTLDVGLKVESTTANYVTVDNATLWYFGDMEPEQALNEMAKIDVAASIAILDTCLTHKMNVDTVALVNEAIEKGKTLTTADELYQVDEDLYWAIFKANRSLRDYSNYHDIIADAEKVVATEWSEYVVEQKAALEVALAEAKENYEAAIMAEPELVLAGEDLREAIALVELDSLYIMLDIVAVIPDELEEEGLIGDELGQYSEETVQILRDLEEEAREALGLVDAGEMTAVEASIYIKRLQDGINTLYASANYYDEFPFHVGEADGTVANIQDMGSGNQCHFTSKTYFLGEVVKTLRFTFDDSYVFPGNGEPRTDTNGNPCVAIAEFYIYDGDGFQVELTAENFSTNAQEPNEGAIAGICDGSYGTFWHSMWSTGITAGEKHYLEVTLPDGLDLTSFSFGWVSRSAGFVIPNNVTVTKISNIESDLRAAINNANNLHVAQGTDPGFVNKDLSAFFAAIAAGEALAGTTASDADKKAAIEAINAEMAKLEDVTVELPVAGKKYRIISGLYGFYEKQGVHKALASRNDTLWWMDAAAENAMQEFEFEPIANEAGEPLYKVKNVGSGNYLNKLLEYYDADSINKYVRFPLSAAYDTIKLASLGDGVFQIMDMAGNKLHANRHNGGTLGTDTIKSHDQYFGVLGEETAVIAWDEGRNSASAWYIREMQTLPCTLTPVADVYTLHLYSSINTLSLTADKDCAFADLKFYDLFGKPVDASKYSVNVSGKTALVMFDGIAFESLQFTFTNDEGVSIVVDGSVSSLSRLQTAYDEAVAVAPEEGEGVMQYKDLADYKAAIAYAEKLLASGATDDEVDAAIASLEAAVSSLQPNMPVAGKAYYIVSAYFRFEEKHGIQMMMYDNGVGNLRWSYENTVNSDRQWMFEAAEVEEGAPTAFYIQNVATGNYMGMAENGAVPTAGDKESAQTYTLETLQGSIIALVGTYSGAKQIHCEGHNQGSGRLGNIVTWNEGLKSASAWRICEVETYGIEDAIENIEISEETENIVKGIYDLFGRKVQNPEKGIYIIDGKKRVVR